MTNFCGRSTATLTAIGALGLLLSCFPAARGVAQDDFGAGFGDFGTFDPLGQLGGLDDENPIAVTAEFEIGVGTDRGRLKVSAELAPQWHVYSLTQPKGGPTATSIKVTGPEGVELAGPFVPSTPPKQGSYDAWPGLPIEEHEGEVTWTAPFKLANPGDAEQLQISVEIVGLSCRTDGSCVPLDKTLTAEFAGTYEPPKPSGEYRADRGVVTWIGEISPATMAPGTQAELRLTAKPDDTFHVYAATTTDASNSTNLVLNQLGPFDAGTPKPSTEPVSKAMGGGTEPVSYHEGEVTWVIPLTVPKGAEAGEYEIQGAVAYQACTDTSCRLPQAFRWSVPVVVAAASGEVSSEGSAPLAFEKASSGEVLELAAKTDWLASRSTVDPTVVAGAPQFSLPVILGMALIGGLILNLMPCVLPVVGLKLLALVDTAGDDHSKVLRHNLWYSMGLLSIFWILAAIAIGVRISSGDEASFSWGQQFTFWQFRLALTLLVFVMALSFLGTWEIPLPGFASGKASQQLQAKEGPAGAFFKGVFTTILATPCSGPLLGVVFGFTLASSPAVTLLIFTTVGLGMALPYIIIGLAPRLVYWLPKPGPWMETLKQLMAFVLLGTVAFLFAGFSDEYKLFVFVTLVGAWFACWLIGQVPNWKPFHQRFGAWSGGIASAALIGFLAFRLLIPGEEVLPWQPYSEGKLKQLQAQGRTVMVDFTAKWCVNCIVNYNVALNTEETAEMMEQLDAVPMLADWTDRNDEIEGKLRELGSASIPVLAIYPGGRPGEPIVLRDLVNQKDVLQALESAGPSVTKSVATR